MKLSGILLVLICVVTLSCNAKPHKIDNKKGVKDDTSIIIINKLPPNKIMPIYYDNIFETISFPIYINNNNDSGSKITITTKQALFLYNYAEEVYYYVKPGEILEVRLDSSNLPVFTNTTDSVRTNELDFFKILNQKIPIPRHQKLVINSVKDFEILNKKYHTWYSIAIAYLRTYRINRPVSDTFAHMAQKLIYYRYIGALVNSNFVSYVNKEVLPNTFLKNFPVCDSCVTIPSYEGAIYGYIKAISDNQNSITQFITSYDSANIKLSGNSKKRELFRLLNINQHTIMGNPQFNLRLNSFFDTYKTDTFVNFLKEDYSKKQLAIRSMEKGGLNELLLSKDGQTISLQSIINKNKGKLIYIDFWASYCIPCLHEVPYSLSLRKIYPNICFIYISLDVTTKSWKNGLNNSGLKNIPNNYLMFDVGKSTIKEYYKIKNIPRYILYGKDGKIISRDAPRPSDPKLKKLLGNNL